MHLANPNHSQIMQENYRIDEDVPEFLKQNPEEVLNSIQQYDVSWSEQRLPFRVVSLVEMHLGFRQTDFLLKRVLVNRCKANPNELIPPARRLFSLVVQIVSKRDFFRDWQIEVVFIMALYGLPSAAVLAIDLLKQEQSRQYTPDLLPRSETIQNLSVFISALAAVGPGEGNHAICNQGGRALKRLLDKVLSPEPVPSRQANAGNFDQIDFGTDMTGLSFPTGNDAEFLQWLDDVEWDKGT